MHQIGKLNPLFFFEMTLGPCKGRSLQQNTEVSVNSYIYYCIYTFIDFIWIHLAIVQDINHLFQKQKNSAVHTLVTNMQREIGKAPPHTCFGKEQNCLPPGCLNRCLYSILWQLLCSQCQLSLSYYVNLKWIYISHIPEMLTYNLTQFMPDFV